MSHTKPRVMTPPGWHLVPGPEDTVLISPKAVSVFGEGWSFTAPRTSRRVPGVTAGLPPERVEELARQARRELRRERERRRRLFG